MIKNEIDYETPLKTHFIVAYSRNKSFNLCGRRKTRSRTQDKDKITCGNCRRVLTNTVCKDCGDEYSGFHTHEDNTIEELQEAEELRFSNTIRHTIAKAEYWLKLHEQDHKDSRWFPTNKNLIEFRKQFDYIKEWIL